MSRSLALSLAVLLVATFAWAQPLSVPYQRVLNIQVPGATAAYSVNSLYVEASAKDGVVTVIGKNPGTASVLVVTGVGVQTFEVVVPQPAPAYPPGFEPPIPEARLAENGSYEVRYTSDPGQLQNIFEFRRSQGERTVRFRVSNVDYVQGEVGPGQSRIGLAQLSYDILTPQREITIADQQVVNSPLTLDNVLLRGAHWREGSWTFHGGFASLASFQNFFLPVEREAAVGLGYRVRLSDDISLTPNVFYFDTHSRLGIPAQSGAMLSLVLRSDSRAGLDWLAEIGYGKSTAFAAAMNYQGGRQLLRGKLRYEPKRFSSLALNNLHGLLSDLDWQYEQGRWTSNLHSSMNRYLLAAGAQNNFSNNWSAQAQLGHGWAALSGLSLAYFSAPTPKSKTETVHTVQLPLGLSFNRAHYGLTGQYRYAHTGGAGGGHGARLSARRGWNGWQLGAYFDRQSQVTTLAALLSDTPGLQDALDRLGIAATSPQQVADLLRNNAVLEALGFVNGYGLNISPVNLQAGSDLSWSQSGGSRQQLNFSFLYNNNESIHGGVQALIYSGSYSRKIGDANELFGSFSIFHAASQGTQGENHPVLQVGMRHTFATVPSWIVPGRKGTISGQVFEDAQAEGRYSSGLPPIAGVELLLDGTRRTRSDERGHYSFSHVPYGDHQVEVLHRSERPFYFTTLSRQRVAVDNTADFGITYSLGQLIGYIQSDAGSGIAGVSLTIQAPSSSLHAATTNDEGKFAVAGLAPGVYQISVQPESVPPGYKLSEIQPTSADVRPARASRVDFVIAATRSIAGRIMRADKQGNRVPGTGVTVELVERKLQTQTDGEGYYLFRDLPAGKHTVLVFVGGKEYRREVELGATPVASKGNDFVVGELTAPASSGDTEMLSQTSRASSDMAASADHLGDIFFDFGQHLIRPDQLPIVRANIGFLEQHPEVMVVIAGHCDSRGGLGFNRQLGTQRAETIKRAFSAAGIRAERMRVISYGSERPFCFEANLQCWGQNRRVHISAEKQ